MLWKAIGLIAIMAAMLILLGGCGRSGDDAALQKLDESLQQIQTLMVQEDLQQEELGASSAILEARVLCRDDLAKAQAEPGGIAGQLRQACDKVWSVDLAPERYGDGTFSWLGGQIDVNDAITHLDWYMLERE